MANASNTLAGIVALNDLNNADLNVTDLLQDAPLLARLAAVPASSGATIHYYMKQTVAAGAEFRAVNTGVANAANQDEQVTCTCKYLDGSYHRDVAIARAYRKGVGAFMERETMKALRSLFQGLEKQILQSTVADADGFTGLPGNTGVDALTDAMVVNAGGSGGRSCWLLRTGVDDLAIVAGNDGVIKFQWEPDKLTWIATSTSTGAGYHAYAADLGAWFGLQFGSIYSVGRIVNLDSTSSHTLSDAWLSKALAKFPAARGANLIVMDRVLLQELQASRTATNPTGQPAPFPDSAFGVPIVVTDQLGAAESAITTTTTTTTTTTGA